MQTLIDLLNEIHRARGQIQIKHREKEKWIKEKDVFFFKKGLLDVIHQQ